MLDDVVSKSITPAKNLKFKIRFPRKIDQFYQTNITYISATLKGESKNAQFQLANGGVGNKFVLFSCKLKNATRYEFRVHLFSHK